MYISLKAAFAERLRVLVLRAYSSAGEHRPYKPRVAGSNPAVPMVFNNLISHVFLGR